jgi:hypothetical protein
MGTEILEELPLLKPTIGKVSKGASWLIFLKSEGMWWVEVC